MLPYSLINYDCLYFVSFREGLRELYLRILRICKLRSRIAGAVHVNFILLEMFNQREFENLMYAIVA